MTKSNQRSCMNCNSKLVCKIHTGFDEQIDIFSGYLSSKDIANKVPGSFLDLWSALAGICTQFTPLPNKEK